MNAERIIINGVACRVEANWHALVSYLRIKGKNDLNGMAALGELAPSDIADLMACCLNEGARLDKVEGGWTGEKVGEVCSMGEISQFMTIYLRQTSPQLPAAGEKK